MAEIWFGDIYRNKGSNYRLEGNKVNGVSIFPPGNKSQEKEIKTYEFPKYSRPNSPAPLPPAK